MQTALRKLVEQEFEKFFEFDTENRSVVTSVSARLFAEHMVQLFGKQEHILYMDTEQYEKLQKIERELHAGSDAMRDAAHRLWLRLSEIKIQN